MGVYDAPLETREPGLMAIRKSQTITTAAKRQPAVRAAATEKRARCRKAHLP
jgi:hypothetical protein